jgi:hypothetical protein
MKKIASYTCRGSITGNGNAGVALPTERIALFDGSFQSAYKVKSFKLLTFDAESYGILHTTFGTLGGSNLGLTQDAADNTQIAWTSAPTNGIVGSAIVDEDNLIVEDLFVTLASGKSANGKVSYIIEMEKYSITDWQGALALVRNNSQSV